MPSVCEIVRQELWRHANIDIHSGKTKIWNRSGVTPTGVRKHNKCNDPDAGDQDIPVSQQGMKVLGVPLGRDECAARFLEVKTPRCAVRKDPVFSSCAATRANFNLRNMSPEVARSFAISHDTKVHHCLCQTVGVDPDDVSTLPFHLGGLGLASAVRTREGAH